MTKFQKNTLKLIPWIALAISFAINIYQFQNRNKNVTVDHKINDQEIKQIKKNIINSQDCEMNYQPQIENL